MPCSQLSNNLIYLQWGDEITVIELTYIILDVGDIIERSC